MKNIFVGNLSFGTTEQDIRALFEAYGSVDRVNIVTDRDTGQPRGFAFVEMTNDAEGDKAIDAVNGREVGGRALNVNEARPKSEGGGGGRGRRVDSPTSPRPARVEGVEASRRRRSNAVHVGRGRVA